jgi:hypothetical protein
VIDDAIYHVQYLDVRNSHYIVVSRCNKLVIIYGVYFETATALQKLFTIGSTFCPKQTKSNTIFGKLNNNNITDNVFGITINSNGDCFSGSNSTRSNFAIYGSYVI